MRGELEKRLVIEGKTSEVDCVILKHDACMKEVALKLWTEK